MTVTNDQLPAWDRNPDPKFYSMLALVGDLQHAFNTESDGFVIRLVEFLGDRQEERDGLLRTVVAFLEMNKRSMLASQGLELTSARLLQDIELAREDAAAAQQEQQ